jgi:hypothetical protein
MSSPPATASIALRAIAVMAEWRRTAAAHLALSGGVSCACGSAFDGIAAVDLERDLVDYVYDKHRETPAARAIFERAGCGADASGDLASLLRALAEVSDPGDASAAAVLQDLERAIYGLAQSRPR